MKDKSERGITIFDLDHTLTCSNVSFSFGKYLFEQGYFSRAKLVLLVLTYALQRCHLVSVQALHAVSFYLLFSKKQVEPIKKMASEFIEESLSKLLRPEMLTELENAKKRGDEVWLESSSPDFLVSLIAKKLQVDDFLATSYQEDHKGIFEKIGLVVDGQVKLQHLKESLEMCKRPLDRVTAYSDSIVDLPLLENVGTPIAVYPEKQLNKIASKKLWRIIN